jgi:hypothetical protein
MCSEGGGILLNWQGASAMFPSACLDGPSVALVPSATCQDGPVLPSFLVPSPTAPVLALAGSTATPPCSFRWVYLAPSLSGPTDHQEPDGTQWEPKRGSEDPLFFFF